MFYLFTGTPSICDVALIRPSVRTGAPSPSGKAVIARQVFMDSILIPSPAFAGVFFWNGGGWERMGFGGAKCWRNPRRFPMQTATGFFAPGRYTLAKDGIDLPVQRLGGGKYGNKRTSGGEAAALPPAGHRERIPSGVFGPGRGRGGLSAGRGVGRGGAVWAVRPLRRGGGGGGRVGGQRVLHAGRDLLGVLVFGGPHGRDAVRRLGDFGLCGGLCLF